MRSAAMTPLSLLLAVVVIVIIGSALAMLLVLLTNRHNLKYWPHVYRKPYPPLKDVLKDGYKPSVTMKGWTE
jgi:hypothetical protein